MEVPRRDEDRRPAEAGLHDGEEVRPGRRRRRRYTDAQEAELVVPKGRRR